MDSMTVWWHQYSISKSYGLNLYSLSSFKTNRFGIRNELVPALWPSSHLSTSASDPHPTHSLMKYRTFQARLPYWVLTAFPNLKPFCRFPLRKAHASHGEDCWMLGKNLLHWEYSKKDFQSDMSAPVSNFNIYTCIGDERQFTNILIYTAKVKEKRKCRLKKDEPGWMSMPIMPVPGRTLGSRPVQFTQQQLHSSDALTVASV